MEEEEEEEEETRTTEAKLYVLQTTVYDTDVYLNIQGCKRSCYVFYILTCVLPP